MEASLGDEQGGAQKAPSPTHGARRLQHFQVVTVSGINKARGIPLDAGKRGRYGWSAPKPRYLAAPSRQPPSPQPPSGTVRRLLLIAARHASAELQLASRRLAAWELATAEIHRHMAQPLCHSRCCTTRRRFRGFGPRRPSLGLKADGIMDTYYARGPLPSEVVLMARPHGAGKAPHFFQLPRSARLFSFLIGRTLRWTGI